MYKNGVAIMVVYQARDGKTGKTIKMDVYDETQALDAGKSIAAMTEIGIVGRYYATFTPDAEGEWIVITQDSVTGKGKVVSHYHVIGHNMDSIGDEVAAVKTKTDNLPVDPADQSQVEVAITATESNIRGADNDTLKNLSDQLDAVESPAMVG